MSGSSCTPNIVHLRSWVILLYEGLFPRPLQLTQAEEQLLEQLFPELQGAKVELYEQLPWFMLGSFAVGVALPHSFSRRKIRLYIDKPEGPLSLNNLATIVHELCHAQQYALLARKHWGFGFFRPFMAYYFGHFMAHFFNLLFREGWRKAAYLAYREHPLERLPYAYEAHFMAHYPQLASLSPFRQPMPKRPPLWAYALGLFFAFILALIRPCLEGLLLLSVFPLYHLLRRF